MIALVIGLVAGALDVIPMLKNPMAKNKMYKFSIMSVFAQWVLLGLVIPFVQWDVAAWVKGLVLGTLGMTPTMLLTYGRTENLKIANRILIHGGVLGCVIAVVASLVIP